MAKYNNKNNKGYGKKEKSNKKRVNEHGSGSSSNYTSATSKSVPCDGYVGKENDPRWYTHNQRLIADVTKIPFNAQVGFPLKAGDAQILPPAIARISLMLGPGVAKTSSDGINLAGQALFQKVRKDLSTYAPYAQADMTIFVMIMTDIFTRYATILRFFSVANLFSSVNLAFSDALLESMGLDWTARMNFRQNLNDLRARFNTLIYKAQSLYMPAAFPIIERYLWLFSNYFYDHQDPRAQIYLFTPEYFWDLDETGESGTALHPQFPADEWDVATHLDNFEVAIDKIRNSDSMLKIMADMRNAFKDVSPWKFSYVEENYTVLPTYSTEVLSQIENAVILPPLDPNSLDVTQDVNKNTLLWNPEILASAVPLQGADANDRLRRWDVIASDTLMNMHWINPTSDDLVVATRLCPTVSYKSHPTVPTMKIEAMGSDAPVRLTIYKYDAIHDSLNGFDVPYIFAVRPTWDSSAPSRGFINQLDFMDYLAFDWAPRCIATDYELDPSVVPPSYVNSTTEIRPIVEIDNYSIIRKDLMTRIHNNVIMSMWNVPELGTSYN